MARPTYGVRALVLRRTKLGESDVIVTLLARDGSQIQAVAKGARKPTSSFSSRLELFCVCDLLLVEGKSLDIVKEARLIEGFPSLRGNIELTTAASPILELLARSTYPAQVNDHLFEMVVAGLTYIAENSSSNPNQMLAAVLLKTLAFLGFRPSFINCVTCGATVLTDEASDSLNNLPFSYLDGGVVCAHCSNLMQTVPVKRGVIEWANALLYSLFSDIKAFLVPENDIRELLRFLQIWLNIQLQFKLKSLDFLFVFYGW